MGDRFDEEHGTLFNMHYSALSWLQLYNLIHEFDLVSLEEWKRENGK